MHVFRITREYRKIGIGYGLPFFVIECGIGVSYTPEALLQKLVKEEANVGDWVVIKNGLKEQGCGVLVEGLKQCKCKVEMEEDGTYKDPMWFPRVDRWLVLWANKGLFNYSALRPRQDLVMYDGTDVPGFLKETESLQCLKALIVDKPEEVWDLVKKHEIRVYRRENG